MKIYQLSYADKCVDDFGHASDNGTAVRWYSSRREAEKDLAQLRRNDEVASSRDPVIRQMIITPSRDGILRWLNNNFTTDNG